MTNSRAGIYTRVSTDEQAYNYSLQTQLSACRDTAVKLNSLVIAEFSEDYTGTKLSRPALDQLRELIDTKQIDTVIVYELDRLARKLSGQIIIEEEFKRQGVTIEYALGEYPDTPEGRLNKHIRATIAEFEREKIVERMMRGKHGKVEGGEIMKGAFAKYGYRFIEDEKGGDYYGIEESEARIVYTVYQWFVVEGLTKTAIIRRLKELEIPTRHDLRGDSRVKLTDRFCWSLPTLHNLLSDETYTGVWHYGKETKVNGKKVKRAKSECVAVPVPAIVSRDLWNAAQAKLCNAKKYIPRHTKREYLMRCRLNCGVCGRALSGETVKDKGKEYMYYRCGSNWMLHATGETQTCRCRYRVSDVDSAVWGVISDMLSKPENLLRGLRDHQAEIEQGLTRSRSQLEIAENELNKAERSKARLLDLYLGDELAKDVYVGKQRELETRITGLQGEIADIRREIEGEQIPPESLDIVESYCNLIKDRLGSATFPQKSAIVAALNVTAVIRPGERKKSAVLVISGFFGDSVQVTSGDPDDPDDPSGTDDPSAGDPVKPAPRAPRPTYGLSIGHQEDLTANHKHKIPDFRRIFVPFTLYATIENSDGRCKQPSSD
jgi:site-specific DNA recombinase